jgi:hypothetical protein
MELVSREAVFIVECSRCARHERQRKESGGALLPVAGFLNALILFDGSDVSLADLRDAPGWRITGYVPHIHGMLVRNPNSTI